MGEPLQRVPRLVWFSMVPVVILSTGLVTKSCVILFYCLISIAVLFVCVSLVFITGSYGPESQAIHEWVCPGGKNCIIMCEVAKMLVVNRKSAIWRIGAVAMGGLDKSGNFIFKPPFKPFCFHLGCEIQTKLDFFSTFCRKLFVYTRIYPIQVTLLFLD